MSMADRDGIIWYDGKLVPWRDATTHVLTHSLHYGLAVFEGVRAYATAAGPEVNPLSRYAVLEIFRTTSRYMLLMVYLLSLHAISTQAM